MPSSKSRLRQAFKVASFDPIHFKLPDGREFDMPRHFRVLGPDGAIVASGPYAHEGTMTFMLRCAAEFITNNPTRARQLLADSAHMRMKVPLASVAEQNAQAGFNHMALDLARQFGLIEAAPCPRCGAVHGPAAACSTVVTTAMDDGGT